jgi:hypothetical protein
MKHMRAFANLCNAGIDVTKMASAAQQACSGHASGLWSPISAGYSAYGLEKKLEKNNFTQKQVYVRILKFLSTCYGCGAKVLSTKQVYMCKFMVPCI